MLQPSATTPGRSNSTSGPPAPLYNGSSNVYVTDSDWFGLTGGDGSTLIDVPPGSYRAYVWHPLLPDSEEATVRDVIVSDSERARASWRLDLKAPIGERVSTLWSGAGGPVPER